MAIHFVHGVPDTERVWLGVLSRLERSDVEAGPPDADHAWHTTAQRLAEMAAALTAHREGLGR